MFPLEHLAKGLAYGNTVAHPFGVEFFGLPEEQAVRDGIIDRDPAKVTGWQREYQRAEDELDAPAPGSPWLSRAGEGPGGHRLALGERITQLPLPTGAGSEPTEQITHSGAPQKSSNETCIPAQNGG